MKSLIDVFRMKEINPKTRASIIISLGKCLNSQDPAYIDTDPLVYELVFILDSENKILENPHYIYAAREFFKNNTTEDVTMLLSRCQVSINKQIKEIEEQIEGLFPDSYEKHKLETHYKGYLSIRDEINTIIKDKKGRVDEN